MKIATRTYGIMPDGREVTAFTLTNTNEIKIEIINFGGIITSIVVPDRNGQMSDIALGYDSLSEYLKNPPFFGALIGRYANRIEGARFILNGTEYILNANEGRNQLHGGFSGFDKRVWDFRILVNGDCESLELSLFSPDGDEEYPGNLEVRVIYTLTEDNTLEIKYYAVSDMDTVVNLTNHAYFNLAGYSSGTILSHTLKLNSDFYTPINNECLPTGEIISVKGTPMDFTSGRAIGEYLEHYEEYEQMRLGNGYDHNWVLRDHEAVPKEAAELYEPQSGRLMRVFTTKPGIQFYSGNYLKSAGQGKGGTVYDKWQGLCLETQYFPNSMKYSHFPSPVLKAGQTYHHTTIYQFGVK